MNDETAQLVIACAHTLLKLALPSASFSHVWVRSPLCVVCVTAEQHELLVVLGLGTDGALQGALRNAEPSDSRVSMF